MSSQIEELIPLVITKGTTMRTFIDHYKPEEDPQHNWVEVLFDGKKDSEVFEIPKHWHRDHDEIMQVLEGRMIVHLNGRDMVVSAGDAPVVILRGQIHGIKGIKGERLRFTERTRPAGSFKARFFQDLLQNGGFPGFLMIMRVFYDGDTYAALGGYKIFDYLFILIVGFIAKAFVPAKPKALKRMKQS